MEQPHFRQKIMTKLTKELSDFCNAHKVPKKYVGFLTGLFTKHSKNNWISVKDRLPNVNERVLVACDQKKYNPCVTILVMPSLEKYYEVMKTKRRESLWFGATHWMEILDPCIEK